MTDVDKLKDLCERLRVQRDNAISVAERATLAGEKAVTRLRVVEAENVQLRELLKDAREWNWIDFDEEDANADVSQKLIHLDAAIQAALEAKE